MDILLVAGSYEGFSPNINAQQCVNLIPFYDKEADTYGLIGRPGLDNAVRIYTGANPVRGMAVMGGKLWLAIGDRLYSRTTGGSNTNEGTLDTSDGPVDFAVGDGNKLFFTDGTSGYTVVSGSFAKITDADFPAGPVGAVHIGGWYITAESGTGNFWVSDSDDPTSWAATSYAVAEANPDNLITVKEVDGNLWLVGEKGYEIWFNSGNTDFPFEAITNATTKIGGLNPYAWAVYEKTAFFVDSQAKARAATGAGTRVISTPQIEYKIAQETVTDIVAFVIPFEGHVFVLFISRDAGESWCYDLTTGLWSTWTAFSGSTAFNVWCYQYFNNQHIVGNWAIGDIYELNSSEYQDDGNDIKRYIVTRKTPGNRIYKLTTESNAKIALNGKARLEAKPTNRPGWFTHSRFEILAEPGHGTMAWELKWSDDSGHTWSTGSTRTMANADYDAKAIWNRLGMARG